MELSSESLAFAIPAPAAAATKSRPKPDKWSAHEHLAHLALHNEKTAGRIQRALTEDEPELPGYKAETEPAWPALLAMSTEELIECFQSSRRALVSLARGCTPEQLRRRAIHPQFGAMDVSQWLEFFLLHEAHHLYVIATLARG